MNSLPTWLIPILLSIGIPGAIAILLRVFPKKRLMDMTLPVSSRLGKALSAVLLIRLGKKAADSIEEGVFVTVACVGIANLIAIIRGMLLDNAAESFKNFILLVRGILDDSLKAVDSKIEKDALKEKMKKEHSLLNTDIKKAVEG